MSLGARVVLGCTCCEGFKALRFRVQDVGTSKLE